MMSESPKRSIPRSSDQRSGPSDDSATDRHLDATIHSRISVRSCWRQRSLPRFHLECCISRNAPSRELRPEPDLELHSSACRDISNRALGGKSTADIASKSDACIEHCMDGQGGCATFAKKKLQRPHPHPSTRSRRSSSAPAGLARGIVIIQLSCFAGAIVSLDAAAPCRPTKHVSAIIISHRRRSRR